MSVAKTNGTKAAQQEKPSKVGGAANWMDERLGIAGSRKEESPQGVPRPLVLHARRDRSLELRGGAAHRRLPELVVPPQHGHRPVPRLLRPLREISMSEAYASTLGHLLSTSALVF
jgi:hypothetical protein